MTSQAEPQCSAQGDNDIFRRWDSIVQVTDQAETGTIRAEPQHRKQMDRDRAEHMNRGDGGVRDRSTLERKMMVREYVNCDMCDIMTHHGGGHRHMAGGEDGGQGRDVWAEEVCEGGEQFEWLTCGSMPNHGGGHLQMPGCEVGGQSQDVWAEEVCEQSEQLEFLKSDNIPSQGGGHLHMAGGEVGGQGQDVWAEGVCERDEQLECLKFDIMPDHGGEHHHTAGGEAGGQGHDVWREEVCELMLNDEERSWNEEMLSRWTKSKLNWRDREWVEEFEIEESSGQVYSPKGGTGEETEKIKRREEIRKRRILENAWDKFYSSRTGLIDSQSGWRSRSTKDMRMIKVEESRERLRLKQEREKRYGKKIANSAKNVKNNDDELAWKTRKKMEISEAKANLEERNRSKTDTNPKIKNIFAWNKANKDYQKERKRTEELWRELETAVKTIDDAEHCGNEGTLKAKKVLTVETVDEEEEKLVTNIVEKPKIDNVVRKNIV